jgi:beta-lactamase class A
MFINIVSKPLPMRSRMVVGGLAALLSATAALGGEPTTPSVSSPPAEIRPLHQPSLEKRIDPSSEYHPIEYSGISKLQSMVMVRIEKMKHEGHLAKDEHVSFFVYDLRENKTLASINKDMPMPVASMVKPFYALAYFKQLDLGHAPAYDSSMRELLEKMIQKSDNVETNRLVKVLGGPQKVHQILRDNYGELLRHTSIVQYIPQKGDEYKNMASASDFGRFLHALTQRKLPHADDLLNLMIGEKKKNPIRIAPLNLKNRFLEIYNKTGSTAIICGDMGIMRMQDSYGNIKEFLAVGIIKKDEKATDYLSWITKRAATLRELSSEIPKFYNGTAIIPSQGF